MKRNDLIPDLIKSENSGKESQPNKENLEKSTYLAEIIRKIINFVYHGSFLGAKGLQNPPETFTEMSAHPKYILSTPVKRKFSAAFLEHAIGICSVEKDERSTVRFSEP